MKQKYTLHTHTSGFDGKNTIAEMVACARDMGFNTVGISNHFIVHPNIKQSKMYPFSVHGGYSNIYASAYELYLPNKTLLSAKLQEWIEEFEQ